MNPIVHLAANLPALALGVLCAVCVVRAVATLPAGDRPLIRVWLLRAVGAGCLRVAASVRQGAGA